MRLYIDTEFNEFRGELISMALVDELGREFYEVVPCLHPGKWVAQNVMPILGKPAVPMKVLQSRLWHWLGAYQAVEVIADWPEDIAHFCRTLITGPGERISTPVLSLSVRHDLNTKASLMPHNALADARAMRLMDLGLAVPA